jgi:hypothetical protein
LTPYVTDGRYNELEALLTYVWEEKKIKELHARGTIIEVFIGAEDKIVDAKKSFDFFSDLVNCYFIKNVGHLLQ